MPAGQVLPATVKSKGTLRCFSAIAVLVVKAAAAMTADARKNLGRLIRMCVTSCLKKHTSDSQKQSRQVSVQKSSSFFHAPRVLVCAFDFLAQSQQFDLHLLRDNAAIDLVQVLRDLQRELKQLGGFRMGLS